MSPIQHSPCARKTRSQARNQTVLTQTLKVPLDGTPTVSQLKAQLEIGAIMTLLKCPGEENSVKEEESDGAEAFPTLVGASQGTRGPTLAPTYHPFFHHYEPSLLAIMQKNYPNYGQS
ncbi:hypothetical protein O181_012227 [Austropuccinia psidii MF-1]|uniref:Uncharacterized protein n=1 Tax=Austropuccinia psidii MF-1 TaxID=1389203 RepID=A0A9Q3GMT8_9BASI|nr:hypothetical protein [Austropuccinia psidii MF-1]